MWLSVVAARYPAGETREVAALRQAAICKAAEIRFSTDHDHAFPHPDFGSCRYRKMGSIGKSTQ